MKKIITIAALLAGVGCFLVFQIIGSEVAADGTLVEPFYVLPIGYLCMVIGIGAGVMTLFGRRKNNRDSMA